AAAVRGDQPQDATPDPLEHRAQPGAEARVPRARDPLPRYALEDRRRGRRRHRARDSVRVSDAERPIAAGRAHVSSASPCSRRYAACPCRSRLRSTATSGGTFMRVSRVLRAFSSFLAAFAVLGTPAAAQTANGDAVAEPFKLGT